MYFVYLLTNKHKTVFYTGMTNDLERRVWEHKNEIYGSAFSKRYRIHYLIYYEELPTLEDAFHREKQIKKYKVEWKVNLIRELNPEWRDLYEDFII